MSYVERYREMLAAKRKPFALVDGQLFARQQRWVAPVGPAAQRYSLTREQARELQKKLGGWWVSWTEGFGANATASEWYAVICRKHKPVEEISSGNTRSKIRRGLKFCEVRRVDAGEIANHGYDTYRAALQSYSAKASVPSPEEFAQRVLTDAPFADIKHHWAVYHEGRMVAFAHCLLYDRSEVDYTLIKLHPDYLNRYPSYALFHSMNQFYLEQERFEYVNDGFRSILHETGVQDFLVREFEFEKMAVNLRLQFRQPVAALLPISAPLHPVLSRVDRRLKSVLELWRLRAA
jgi:hypothetical protein